MFAIHHGWIISFYKKWYPYAIFISKKIWNIFLVNDKSLQIKLAAPAQNICGVYKFKKMYN